MGELRKFYSLATVVFVGRSLVDLGPRQHGSDMIEPAALAKPVMVGPYTGNFADVMSRFREAGAMVEVTDEAGLLQATRALLENPARAAEMGEKARSVVVAGKGATAKHVDAILAHLPRT
jgi:3-deoxy-D-manno-octulosonic-acid transferase